MNLIPETRIQLSNGDVRLWRNNVGRLQDRTGKWVAYGLCVSSSDLIGFKSILVTPDMVGCRLAVFVALEGKVGRDRLTQEQTAFIATVETMGGIAGEFRSVEQAREILGVNNG